MQRFEARIAAQSIDTFAREAYVPNMRSNFVSLHPYFKVNPGKLAAFKAALPAFLEKGQPLIE